MHQKTWIQIYKKNTTLLTRFRYLSSVLRLFIFFLFPSTTIRNIPEGRTGRPPRHFRSLMPFTLHTPHDIYRSSNPIDDAHCHLLLFPFGLPFTSNFTHGFRWHFTSLLLSLIRVRCLILHRFSA